jgi:hypothetical protein
MTIRTRKQALAAAQRQTRNVPGTCQANVRAWFNAPSAGDQDHDNDSDAVDGWLSEPKWARHVGDRNPPNGYPLAFNGGSHGYGHRALSAAKSVFSTDMENNRYKAGVTSRVTGTSVSDAIAKIERSMGVKYVGWSETIDGQRIPKEPTTVKTPSLSTMAVQAPKRTPARWNKFVHLDPKHYMNYHQAVLHLKPGQRIDIDEQKSASGTGFALHWPTVGQNHLHDPKGLIRPTRRIDSLTNAEIRRLKGPHGEQVFGIIHLLREVFRHEASAEVELKCINSVKEIKRWLSNVEIKELNRQGRLQFKGLAASGNVVKRLAPAPEAGGTTIMSFTKYEGAGVYKSLAWPVTDYVRGTPKWR